MKKNSTNYAIKMLGFTGIAFMAMLKPAFSQEPAFDNDLITYSMTVSPDQQVKFRFPLDIRSGDMITGTVVEEKKNNAGEVNKASSTLQGVVIEIDGKQTKLSNHLISFLVPAGLTSLPFLLKNAAGEVIERGQIPIGISYIDPMDWWWDKPLGGLGAKFSTEAVGQPGQALSVTGFFDGNAANTNVSLNGQACEIIAESPRMSYVQVPQNANAGVSNLTIEENNSKEEHNVNIAVLSLSANKTLLRKGEKATITVTVSGLESLKEGNDAKVNITNLAPEIVRFKSITGNSISQTIPSGLSGDYTFSFSIVGVTQGDYVLEGLLFCAPNPNKSDRDFGIEVGNEQDDMALIQLLQELNRAKDYDASQHGGENSTDWYWKRVKVVMNRLHNMGWDPDPADPNFLRHRDGRRVPVR